MRKLPPRKKPQVETGRRRFDGALLDVTTATTVLGNASDKQTRSQISRGLIPARRLGGRIVIIREELMARLRSLPLVVERPS